MFVANFTKLKVHLRLPSTFEFDIDLAVLSWHFMYLATNFVPDSGARGAPWVSKFGNPLIRKILVLTSAYVRPSIRPSVCPYRLWGRVRGVPRQRDGGGGMPPFFLVAEVNIMAAGSSYAILNCKTFLE